MIASKLQIIKTLEILQQRPKKILEDFANQMLDLPDDQFIRVLENNSVMRNKEIEDAYNMVKFLEKLKQNYL